MINRPTSFHELVDRLRKVFDEETVNTRLNLLYNGAKLTGYSYDEIMRCGFFTALPVGKEDLIFVTFYTDPADDDLIPIEEPVNEVQ